MRVAVPFGARPIAVLLLVAAALVACGEPPPPDLSGSRPVTFESRDGVTLEGRLFGDGIHRRRAVAHAARRSAFVVRVREPSGRPGVPRPHVRLPRVLPGRRGRLLAGRAPDPAIWQDVLGAVDFIRSQGATTVALVGASMGGTASLVAAGQEGTDVGGGDHPVGPGLDRRSERRTPRCSSASMRTSCSSPGIGDAPAAASAEQLDEIAPPPKRRRDRPGRRPRHRPADGVARRRGPAAHRDLPRTVRAAVRLRVRGRGSEAACPRRGPGTEPGRGSRARSGRRPRRSTTRTARRS